MPVKVIGGRSSMPCTWATNADPQIMAMNSSSRLAWSRVTGIAQLSLPPTSAAMIVCTRPMDSCKTCSMASKEIPWRLSARPAA